MSVTQIAASRNSFLNPLRIAAHVAMLATFACSDATSPRQDDTPRFAATVSGSTERQLVGSAVFDREVPGFGLSLVHPSGLGGENAVRHAIYFRRGLGGAPAVGEYALAEDSGDETSITAGVVLDGDGDDPLLCTATSGTLRVLSATSTRLRGSFSMTALCSRIGDQRHLVPIEVSGSFVASEGTIEAPDEPTAVAGATYVLSSVDGEPVPYLLRDYTDSEGTRSRKWLVADTIEFATDGQLGFLRAYRHREESPDSPADDWEYTGWTGGYFHQSADKVAVAWGYDTPPMDAQYSDTLRLGLRGLVRVAHLVPGCLVCPVGPLVEYVYVRV